MEGYLSSFVTEVTSHPPFLPSQVGRSGFSNTQDLAEMIFLERQALNNTGGAVLELNSFSFQPSTLLD